MAIQAGNWWTGHGRRRDIWDQLRIGQVARVSLRLQRQPLVRPDIMKAQTHFVSLIRYIWRGVHGDRSTARGEGDEYGRIKVLALPGPVRRGVKMPVPATLVRYQRYSHHQRCNQG